MNEYDEILVGIGVGLGCHELSALGLERFDLFFDVVHFVGNMMNALPFFIDKLIDDPLGCS